MAYPIGRLEPETREALREIGWVVRLLRGERSLTQKVLAVRAGLSQSTISRLECGLADGLRLAQLARVLAALEAPIEARPDDRPVAVRSHALRRLAHAYSAAAWNKLRWERELERRDRIAMWVASQEQLRGLNRDDKPLPVDHFGVESPRMPP